MEEEREKETEVSERGDYTGVGDVIEKVSHAKNSPELPETVSLSAALNDSALSYFRYAAPRRAGSSAATLRLDLANANALFSRNFRFHLSRRLRSVLFLSANCWKRNLMHSPIERPAVRKI